MKKVKDLVLIFVVVFALFFGILLYFFDLSYTGDIVKGNFNTQYAIDHIDEVISDYNQNSGNIPAYAKTLLGDEKINLAITMNDGSIKRYWLSTNGGRIAEYGSGEADESSMTITTSEKTIDFITSSKKPADELANAVNDGSLNIESSDFMTGLKILAAKNVIGARNA